MSDFVDDWRENSLNALLGRDDAPDKEGLISDIVKEYPHMFKIVIYHNSYHLPRKLPKTEYEKEVQKIFKQKTKEQKAELNIQRSVRRSRTAVKDIMLCNRFDLWCTFTFDRRKLNRFDVDKCRSVMSKWLHNQKLHSPHLQYLVVPEFHKKCEPCTDSRALSCSHDDRPKALHFHALLSNYNGNLKDSKKKTKHGQTIYNATGYRSGFTEFVKIGERFDTENFDTDYARIISYISKYISKDMPMFFGQKRYWVSRGLIRPKTTVNGVAEFKLQNVIKSTKPKYITEYIEVQEHKKIAPLTQERQTSLIPF